jgi:methylated-DNA-[protein]-cysteine S-methyltransferase
MYYQTIYSSPIGKITLASDGKNIVGLWNEDQKYHGHSLPEKTIEKDDLPAFGIVKNWLDRYFAGKRPTLNELPVAPIGSDFRQRVWNALCEIPYGEVTTYGDIAKKIKCSSARAIGGAVGHNPISIIIPCHRVIGSNGSLTGYAGGLDKKIILLRLEGLDVPSLHRA